MSQIQILDTLTANSIAAGEVIERPSSVVKELVENALDADASVITVEIRQGGIGLIRVVDNGCGMDAADACLAFDRHATSKIRTIEDLDAIRTMGFRGEALASIAAVAHVRLETRPVGEPVGTLVELQGGAILQVAPAGCAEGTVFTIENLFYNVPARFKFLKKDSTEASAVADIIERMALARPDVSFRLISQGQELLHTPGNNDLRSAIFAVYGREAASTCLAVEDRQPPAAVHGYIGRPEQARNSRSAQNFYVNGRLVRSRAISAALDEAYTSHLMKRKFPLAVLFITVAAQLVDVNVHPQKMEVRFWDEQAVFRAVYHAVKNALLQGGAILSVETPDSNQPITTQLVQPVPDSSPQLPTKSAQQSPDSGQEMQTPVALPYPDSGIDSEQPARIAEMNVSVYSAAENPPFEKPQSTARQASTPPADAVAKQAGLPPADVADAVARQAELPLTDVASKQAELPLTAAAARQAELPLTAAAALTVSELQRARLVGQLFQTYLLLELDADLLLIDQHAAHERILFEQLVASQRQSSGPLVQPLLVPQTMTVSSRELQLLQAEQEQLQHLGFEFESFGTHTILIRSLPASGRLALQPQAALRVALDTLLDESLDAGVRINELFYRMACKAAVKAHDNLHPEEMTRLLADLQALDDPYHCPHGRPIIIRLSRHEIEKRFKRIV